MMKRRCRVLLAEDDAAAARTLARMLREDGYEVDVALDGAAAIAGLSHAPKPDVLVADYKLPHADGLAVAAYALSVAPSAQVIMVTSYPEVLATQRAERVRVRAVLAKPLAYEELTRALEAIAAELR